MYRPVLLLISGACFVGIAYISTGFAIYRHPILFRYPTHDDGKSSFLVQP